ncbi:ribose 5-phosphate isomerase B [Salinarimonas chemoclinalis]|uniref:ribose 5-phosphate isomerase B n=1 Tax=Salinarimonas chemoclinalis TaxID=3241599 RepID=UPI0035588A4B
MRLAIGCDEAGFALKEALKDALAPRGYELTDYGVGEGETALYPDVAIAVGEAVARGAHDRAILICGTGIGVAISANKVKGVRAAQAHDTYSAERAQKSNDAQILCLGARVIGHELAKTVVDAWLGSHFEGGRSAPKVERIRSYEAGPAA